MTGPERPPDPSVTTAPAEGASPATTSPRAPLGRRRLPPHIGPARTSTVLLALAFVAIGLLYLYVKPPETRSAGMDTDPAATTSRSAVPTTSVPEPATTPEETTGPEETTAPEGTTGPTAEAAPTPTEAPTEAPGEDTVEEPAATTPGGTTTAPAPPTSQAPTTAAPSS